MTLQTDKLAAFRNRLVFVRFIGYSPLVMHFTYTGIIFGWLRFIPLLPLRMLRQLKVAPDALLEALE
jgi:hypothetical protein